MKIFYIYLILTLQFIYATEIESNDKLTLLSQKSTWLKLLYYDLDKKESDVISKDYFLAKDGRKSPLKELKATIEAYSEAFIDQNHSTCRFPARYKWLSKQIELKNYKEINPKCKELIESIKETKIDSLSLMFVSGYLGNPASSFGHSFLKLNKKGKNLNNLFDLSISYGADVPKNENIFSYIFKGLTGGYRASFSDKYFFSQDLIYSNNEFRDIWEYELDFSKEQIRFFQLHLWEILGKKLKYLFLNKNCGYQISKMLEVIEDETFVDSADFWFAPIETFHKLMQIDNSRINNKIVKSKKFHPSEEKKLYKRFQKLSKLEKKATTYLITKEMKENLNRFELTDLNKIDILDFVMNYYNYMITKSKEKKKYKKLKREALLMRFLLPTKRESSFKFKNISEPDKDKKASLLSTTFNYTKEREKYLSIAFSPYSISNSNNELKVLNIDAKISKETISLREFTLFDVKQFNYYSLPFENNLNLSWQTEATLKKLNIKDKSYYDSSLKVGFGKSWSFTNEAFLFYTMLNLSAHSYSREFTSGIEIGTKLNLGRVQLKANLENLVKLSEKELSYDASILTNIEIEKNKNIFFKLEKNINEPWLFSTGLKFYF